MVCLEHLACSQSVSEILSDSDPWVDRLIKALGLHTLSYCYYCFKDLSTISDTACSVQALQGNISCRTTAFGLCVLR